MESGLDFGGGGMSDKEKDNLEKCTLCGNLFEPIDGVIIERSKHEYNALCAGCVNLVVQELGLNKRNEPDTFSNY